MDPTKFYLCPGTVQAFVVRERPWFHRAFGKAEYDRNKPVLSDARRERAQPIVDRMNAGEVSPDEGMALLDRHAFW